MSITIDFDFERRAVCAAFPDGIPAVIWEGRNNHNQPTPTIMGFSSRGK